jgi:hypothetical protein
LKTRLIAAFTAALLIFGFTACGFQQNTGKEPGTTQGTASNKVPPEIIDAAGIYVGQIDSNSIEITIDGTAGAYRYEESLKPVIEALAKDNRVAFTYYENENGQQILTKIAKEKASIKEFTNITGTLTGLIDNNSLEIIVEKNPAIENSGGPMAFRIPEELKPYFDSTSKEYKDFRNDEKMVFSFFENENRQLVLTKLEKAK